MANSTVTSISITFTLDMDVYYHRTYKTYDWRVRLSHPNFGLLAKSFRDLPSGKVPPRMEGSAPTKEVAKQEMEKALAELKEALIHPDWPKL